MSIEFTKEEKQEARLKAFELFAFCIEKGPCNGCPFFKEKSDDDYLCMIGCPNSWDLFGVRSIESIRNRRVVLKALHERRKEKANGRNK